MPQNYFLKDLENWAAAEVEAGRQDAGEDAAAILEMAAGVGAVAGAAAGDHDKVAIRG